MNKEINVEVAKLEIMLDVCRRDKDALNFKLAAMQTRIEKLEEVARVAGFIELNRHNYLFNGRQEADKASVYYMDLLKEKLNALKGDE